MNTIQGIINAITTQVLNPLIVLLFTLATVVFVWGIIMYVIGSQGSDTQLDKGKKVILYGLIGMFVMASAWGIVRMLCNFFGATGPGGGTCV